MASGNSIRNREGMNRRSTLPGSNAAAINSGSTARESFRGRLARILNSLLEPRTMITIAIGVGSAVIAIGSAAGAPMVVAVGLGLVLGGAFSAYRAARAQRSQRQQADLMRAIYDTSGEQVIFSRGDI